MANTAWGASITFGWEFEGDDEAIWDWFRDPADPNMDSTRWLAKPDDEKADWYWDNARGWRSLAKREGQCPDFIQCIESEEPPGVFELKSYPCDSLGTLRHQLLQVHQKLDAVSDYRRFQVHIVFRLPPPAGQPAQISRHGRIAALFHLLNDFVWARSAMQSNHEHYRVFTGPATRKIQRLEQRLTASAGTPGGHAPGSSPLDGRDPKKYKYANFGIRDAYDPADASLVGFEIRKGVHDSLDRLMRCVTIITESLESDVRSIDLCEGMCPEELGNHMRSGPQSRVISLERYYRFKVASSHPVLDQEMMNQLQAEANIVATQGGRLPKVDAAFPFLDEETETVDVTAMPFAQRNKAGMEIFRRWALALRPWESHPSIAPYRDQVVASRMQMSLRLATYLSTPAPQRAQLRFAGAHGPESDIDFVSRQIRGFLLGLRLYTFM